MLLPKLYYIDAQRDLENFEEDLLLMQEDDLVKRMRAGNCMFDMGKVCNHCFSCIGLIHKKETASLNAFEAAKLLEHKLYQLNLDEFSRRVNANFRKNGGKETIRYSMNRDLEKMLSVTTEICREDEKMARSMDTMGKGMRSIYMLSLLETCEETKEEGTDVILVEDPEIYLHPKLQRVTGDILYRLSRTSQVIFSTHAPNLLANFNSREIRQVLVGKDGTSEVKERTDISGGAG